MTFDGNHRPEDQLLSQCFQSGDAVPTHWESEKSSGKDEHGAEDHCSPIHTQLKKLGGGRTGKLFAFRWAGFKFVLI